jgi:hypothetical protein
LLEFAMLLKTIAFASALLGALLTASPGQASSTHYVAGTGGGDCSSPAAACATVAAAILASGSGDTIICLSPPAPAALLIDKSLTIDCSGAPVSFAGGSFKTTSDGFTARVVINVPSGVVRLRGFTVDAAGTDRGIDIQAAAAIYIENSIVSNSAKQGIIDRRTGGQTKLFIKDTAISDNTGAGIVAVSAAVGITVLDNVTSEKNAYGIAVGAGNNVAITNSVFSGNSAVGIEGDPGAQILVSNSLISHNSKGVESNSSVRLFSNDISFNSTAITGASGSLGLNRFSGNSAFGTAPTSIAGAPANIGP